ncbi:hypothetical protein CRG98_005480, partial [Punica granatum]
MTVLYSGCLLVGDFLQWKKETMKEHELFAIPMQGKIDRPSGHSSSCRGGRVKAASGLPAKVGTTRLSCGVGGRDGLGFWSKHISLWRSEDRGWSTHEGWHDSPVVWGGWPGWTASGHSTSRHGE